MQDAFIVGDWHVIPATGQILKGDLENRLEPKAMAVLVYLAEHANEAVTRIELENAIWQGSVVTYESLTATINKIRTSLQDNSRQPNYIETLSKRGYRLIAPVTKMETKNNDVSTIKIIAPKLNRSASIKLITVIIIMLTAIFFYPYNMQSNDLVQRQILTPNIPSIAVIPFSNISGDPTQDYFAAGITEYLITDLSRLSSLLVISRLSVLGFKSGSIDVKNVSEALNVKYILTGSVVKNKNKMRIAVQLTDASNGIQLWANRFDENLDDLFTVQDEISKKIVSELVNQVTHTQQDLRSRIYTSNHEAHDYYIRGNALYTSISKEGNTLAREMFLSAIEIDRNFVSAYSAIALTPKMQLNVRLSMRIKLSILIKRLLLHTGFWLMPICMVKKNHKKP